MPLPSFKSGFAPVPRDFQQNYRARLQVWKSITVPGLVVTFALVVVRFFGLLQPIELTAYDLLLRYRPPEEADPRITLVGITQEDIKALNHYPVYDNELSQVLTNLANAEAKVIGLDIYRDVPVQPGHDELRQTYRTLNNLVAIELTGPDSNPIIAPPQDIPAERIGFANLFEDSDWILRRALLTSQGDTPKSAFALQVARQYLEEQGYRLNAQEEDRLVFELPTGKKRRPIHLVHENIGGYTSDGIVGRATMFKWRQNQQPFGLLTLTEVLKDDFDKELVRDRIVMIGNIASGSKDVFRTPGIRQTLWSQTENYKGDVPLMYGLEIHAHLASQIISRTLGERGDIWAFPSWIEYFLIVAIGLLGTGLGVFLASPLGRFIALGFLAVGLWLVCVWSLSWGLWLPLVPISVALVGAGFTTLFVDHELRVRYEQASGTLEETYNAVHNGPLQSLIVLLRRVEPDSDMHRRLRLLNGELREIYESLREELNRSGHQFTLGKQQLNADEPLALLLEQTYHITIERDFPGFESIVVFMAPDLDALEKSSMSNCQKKRICYFLEEALNNVGKHAVCASRLDVVARRDKNRFILQVIDNGLPPELRPTAPGSERAGEVMVNDPQLPQQKREGEGVATATAELPSVSNLIAVHANDCYSASASQGTQQMQETALAMGGRFERLPHGSRGTVCQLSWPESPPLIKRIKRLLKKL